MCIRDSRKVDRRHLAGDLGVDVDAFARLDPADEFGAAGEAPDGGGGALLLVSL